MIIQKAGQNPRERLRHAMKALVTRQQGPSELQKVGGVAAALGWSETLVRQAMGREATATDWLPQGRKLALLFERTEIDPRWLFTGKGEPEPVHDALERLILSDLSRTPTAARFINKAGMFIDTHAVLGVVCTAIWSFLEEEKQRVEMAAPIRELQTLASPKHRAAADAAARRLVISGRTVAGMDVRIDPVLFVGFARNKSAILD